MAVPFASSLVARAFSLGDARLTICRHDHNLKKNESHKKSTVTVKSDRLSRYKTEKLRGLRFSINRLMLAFLLLHFFERQVRGLEQDKQAARLAVLNQSA
jgi:hypothetical protein